MNDPFKFIVGAVLVTGGILLMPFQPNVGMFLIATGANFVIAGTFGTAQFQDGIKQNVTSTQASLPVVYGRAKVGHVTADIRSQGGDNKNLRMVGALCVASGNGLGIEGIESIEFNGIEAVASPAFPTNTFAMSTTGVTSPFIKGSDVFVHYNTHAGLDAPAVDANLTVQHPTAWPATSLGRGIAYVMLRLTFDEDDEDRVFATGIPQVNYIVRGNRVYDPRFITSGPNADGWCWDAADSDTSLQLGTNGYDDLHPGMNPGLCLYDYLTSDRYGLNLPAAEVDEQSFIDLANHCDEDVTLTGTTGPLHQARYQMNGALSTGTDHKTNIEKILSSCNSNLIWRGGQISVQARKVQTAETFELNEDNIIGQISMSRSGAATPNTITAKFVDEDNDWATMDVVWPEPGTNTYLAEDNDRASPMEIEFPLTTNFHMAQHLAMVAIQELREDVAIELTATEDALVLLTGDVVKVTYDTAGFAAKEFRIVSMVLNDDSTVELKLREYASSVYNLATQADAVTVPGSELPNPFSVLPPTNLTLLSDNTTTVQTADGTVIPRVYATWDKSLDPFLDYESVQWRVGTDEFKALGIVRPNDATVGGQQEIYSPPVSEGDDVHFNIRAHNTLGISSAVLTGNTTASGKDVVPPDVTGLSILQTPEAIIQLDWDNVLINDLSHYEVREGDTDWATANVVGTRIDASKWSAPSKDIAKRAATFRVKAFDRSGLESANDATIAFTDPIPVAALPIGGTVTARAGFIKMRVDTTSTQATRMVLHAELSNPGFTPSNANAVAQEFIREGGLSSQPIGFSTDVVMDDPTKVIYMRLCYSDALTVPLAEGDVCSSEFNQNGVVSAGGGTEQCPNAGPSDAGNIKQTAEAVGNVEAVPYKLVNLDQVQLMDGVDSISFCFKGRVSSASASGLYDLVDSTGKFGRTRSGLLYDMTTTFRQGGDGAVSLVTKSGRAAFECNSGSDGYSYVVPVSSRLGYDAIGHVDPGLPQHSRMFIQGFMQWEGTASPLIGGSSRTLDQNLVSDTWKRRKWPSQEWFMTSPFMGFVNDPAAGLSSRGYLYVTSRKEGFFSGQSVNYLARLDSPFSLVNIGSLANNRRKAGKAAHMMMESSYVKWASVEEKDGFFGIDPVSNTGDTSVAGPWYPVFGQWHSGTDGNQLSGPDIGIDIGKVWWWNILCMENKSVTIIPIGTVPFGGVNVAALSKNGTGTFSKYTARMHAPEAFGAADRCWANYKKTFPTLYPGLFKAGITFPEWKEDYPMNTIEVWDDKTWEGTPTIVDIATIPEGIYGGDIWEYDSDGGLVEGGSVTDVFVSMRLDFLGEDKLILPRSTSVTTATAATVIDTLLGINATLIPLGAKYLKFTTLKTGAGLGYAQSDDLVVARGGACCDFSTPITGVVEIDTFITETVDDVLGGIFAGDLVSDIVSGTLDEHVSQVWSVADCRYVTAEEIVDSIDEHRAGATNLLLDALTERTAPTGTGDQDGTPYPKIYLSEVGLAVGDNVSIRLEAHTEV